VGSRERASSTAPGRGGFGRHYSRPIDNTPYGHANREFCHLFQRGMPCRAGCKRIHGQPTEEQVQQCADYLGYNAPLLVAAPPCARAGASAGEGNAGGDSPDIINRPSAQQMGDIIRKLVTSPSAPDDLFSPAVLGSRDDVYAALSPCCIVMHPEAVITPEGDQLCPKMSRDVFNERWPTSEFLKTVSGAAVLGGGMECGLQALGESCAAGLQRSGLRPGVGDARGFGPHVPVRKRTSKSHVEHERQGCGHMAVKINWALKKTVPLGDRDAHITEFLHTVASWLAAGRNVHIHCIPLLFPPGGFFCPMYCPPCVVVGELKTIRGGPLQRKIVPVDPNPKKIR
jgi:hypothetical protein